MFGVGDAGDAQVDLGEVVDADERFPHGFFVTGGDLGLGFVLLMLGMLDWRRRGDFRRRCQALFVLFHHGFDLLRVDAGHQVLVVVDGVASRQRGPDVGPGKRRNVQEGFDLFGQFG